MGGFEEAADFDLSENIKQSTNANQCKLRKWKEGKILNLIESLKPNANNSAHLKGPTELDTLDSEPSSTGTLKRGRNYNWYSVRAIRSFVHCVGRNSKFDLIATESGGIKPSHTATGLPHCGRKFADPTNDHSINARTFLTPFSYFSWNYVSGERRPCLDYGRRQEARTQKDDRIWGLRDCARGNRNTISVLT